MATYVEGGASRETEGVGLLTEGVAGVAIIALAIIALAGVSVDALASIATIVIGVGLMAQGFNAAGESTRIAGVQNPEWTGEIAIDCVAGLAGIVLGILALVGIHSFYLMAAALIVFGGALLLGGALAMQARPMPSMTAGGTQVVAYRSGASATGGIEVLVGIAAVVLGILALTIAGVGGVLILVGFIAIGATLLTVGATFSTTVLRMFTATAR
ncbi:MAG TPA: hypothetical protein VFA12_18030 [Stellaceae bacterium]|nr:hypothetical protein [Stellaceae bacterium]